MRIGTKTVLYGYHQFLLHPLFVAWAWWKLFGFPLDPRLWVAFFVHDLGYLGKPNLDGPEGELHPIPGAKFMGWLFDRPRRFVIPGPRGAGYAAIPEEMQSFPIMYYPEVDGYIVHNRKWRHFCMYHSRFLAKLHKAPPSRLCIADKLAITLYPRWLFLLLVRATGEIHEYMANAERLNNISVSMEEIDRWYSHMVAYVREWVEEHKDGREDTWTRAERSASVTGVWT